MNFKKTIHEVGFFRSFEECMYLREDTLFIFSGIASIPDTQCYFWATNMHIEHLFEYLINRPGICTIAVIDKNYDKVNALGYYPTTTLTGFAIAAGLNVKNTTAFDERQSRQFSPDRVFLSNSKASRTVDTIISTLADLPKLFMQQSKIKDIEKPFRYWDVRAGDLVYFPGDYIRVKKVGITTNTIFSVIYDKLDGTEDYLCGSVIKAIAPMYNSKIAYIREIDDFKDNKLFSLFHYAEWLILKKFGPQYRVDTEKFISVLQEHMKDYALDRKPKLTYKIIKKIVNRKGTKLLGKMKT